MPAAVKWLVALIAAEWLQVPGVMRALIVCMAADYVTGVGAAVVRRELSSHVAWRGLVRKTLVLVLLVLVRYAERSVGLDLNIEHVCAVGYLVTEFISIVENMARAGVPIPGNLVTVLLAAKKLHSKATPDQIEELTDERECN